MPGETILVVEDEGIIAIHLQRVLTSFGYRVPETAETGVKAIERALALHPDLVLMDIQLRGSMDGIETARQIQSWSDIPVVYLTAFGDDQRLAQAQQTSPYGYLIKPVHERELRATIEMALYKHDIDRKLKASEAAYRDLYHNTPAMLHTTNPENIITQVSDFWLAALGYHREHVIGMPVTDFLTPESRARMVDQILPEFTRYGSLRDRELAFLRRDGSTVDVYFSIVGIFDNSGVLAYAHSALVDITARKRTENAERDQRELAEALRDTAAALSSTLSFDEVLERVLNNVDRVVPHDAVNIMLVDNGCAQVARSHGYDVLAGQGSMIAEKVSVEDEPYLRIMAETGRPVAFPDTSAEPGWPSATIKSYAGAPIIVKSHLVGFINLIGLTPGFFNHEHASRLQAFADQAAIAIENASLYAEVQRLATLDEVTGILNRRRLFELGQREFERARRYGTPLAAILLDIDHFKKINDTYGHNTGDRVLAGIAGAIGRSVREVDLFGRYGGEEFVVLLPQADQQAAVEVAERLRELTAGLQFDTERGRLSCTISLGVAMLTGDSPSLANLIDRADQAMYAAKQAGRNRVEVYR